MSMIAVSPKEDYAPCDFESFHCSTVNVIAMQCMDPSMMLAFYCKTLADFEGLKNTIVVLLLMFYR